MLKICIGECVKCTINFEVPFFFLINFLVFDELIIADTSLKLVIS